MDVDCSGFIEFAEFCTIMHNKLKDTDLENELKETFRVFSKDKEGVWWPRCTGLDCSTVDVGLKVNLI